MASFPARDADVLAFAAEMVYGLAQNPDDFPTPPVGSTMLMNHLNDARAKEAVLQAARAAFAEAVAAKKASFAVLKQAMKDDLRYAEVAVHMNDEKLKSLAWAARRVPKAVAAPGQARELVIVAEGPDWVKLKWKAPNKGGKVLVYRVEQSDAASNGYKFVAASMMKTVLLENLPRGVELTYRVVAENKSGEGMGSNSVRMVL